MKRIFIEKTSWFFVYRWQNDACIVKSSFDLMLYWLYLVCSWNDLMNGHSFTHLRNKRKFCTEFFFCSVDSEFNHHCSWWNLARVYHCWLEKYFVPKSIFSPKPSLNLDVCIFWIYLSCMNFTFSHDLFAHWFLSLQTSNLMS